MTKLLPYILFEKYIYILAPEMASPGNRHCANCIGTHYCGHGCADGCCHEEGTESVQRAFLTTFARWLLPPCNCCGSGGFITRPPTGVVVGLCSLQRRRSQRATRRSGMHTTPASSSRQPAMMNDHEYDSVTSYSAPAAQHSTVNK